jgi:hypothetical protein
VGRVELQESWGSTAYPFSTTFACADKVGVQCQTRLAWGNEDLPAAAVPAFVADFIEAHARQPEAPERTLEFMAPRIPVSWIGTASELLRKGLAAKLDDAACEAKPSERVCAQRLRVTWTGLVEAHYRYSGKDYVVWIPERADALPIALEHPLPSAPGPSPAASHGEDDWVPRADAAAAIATDERQDETRAPIIERPSAHGLPRWLRMSMWWGGALVLVFCLLTWIVNWKP